MNNKLTRLAKRHEKADGRASTRFANARLVALAGACLGLGAAFGPTLATAAVDTAKDVIVRNTDAEPVPTKAIGTTQVAGSVTVDGPVQTTETAVGEPFQQTVSTSISGNGFGQFLQIPDGKRLLVQYVSVFSRGDTPVDFVQVYGGLEGSTAYINVPLERFGRYAVGSEQVQILLDGVTVGASRQSDPDSSTYVAVTVHGRLIDH